MAKRPGLKSVGGLFIFTVQLPSAWKKIKQQIDEKIKPLQSASL